jgi:hypothetical protein
LKALTFGEWRALKKTEKSFQQAGTGATRRILKELRSGC